MYLKRVFDSIKFKRSDIEKYSAHFLDLNDEPFHESQTSFGACPILDACLFADELHSANEATLNDTGDGRIMYQMISKDTQVTHRKRPQKTKMREVAFAM